MGAMRKARFLEHAQVAPDRDFGYTVADGQVGYRNEPSLVQLGQDLGRPSGVAHQSASRLVMWFHAVELAPLPRHPA
jgi:hypothetical protein